MHPPFAVIKETLRMTMRYFRCPIRLLGLRFLPRAIPIKFHFS